MLVPYAGKPNPDHRRSDLAYRHFQLGRDTMAIASMMRVSEPIVLRWITVERCRQRALPIPYAQTGN